MKLSEEQIKNILQQTQLKIEADPHLEEAIIREISSRKQYDQLIQQSKQKAKISLWVSLSITVGLLLTLLYQLFYNVPQEVLGITSMLPSFMVIIALIMLHQLVYFSAGIRKGISAGS